MIKKYLLIFMILITGINPVWCQPAHIVKLENQINVHNDAMQYPKSIGILNKMVNNPDVSSYDKYFAYLFLSYTYKRLFNYTRTIHNLDLALIEGMKTNHSQEAVHMVTAEKSFVYFDNHQYDKAEKLIVYLRNRGYKYINNSAKSWLIMQDGYLKMLNKDYDQSLKLLNQAAAIIGAESPGNLPNIYGKKIELFNAMKLFDKRDQAFKEGLAIAKKYKKIKYEMYLYEVLRNVYQDNNDYRNAFDIQKKYDSIAELYDATDNNSKLELTEQLLQAENTMLKEQNKKYYDYLLYVIILALSMLSYFAFRLYHSNKTRRILVEQENERIYAEIEQLTQQQKAEELAQEDTTTVILPEYDFTDRQREIIGYIKQGLTNKEIGTLLHISENTVKYHLKIIYEIMKVTNRFGIK